MFGGDWTRKTTLAEYGFRLPSCTDNRPLKFEEWDAYRGQTVFVSATPGRWEMGASWRRLRRADRAADRPGRPADDHPLPSRTRSTTLMAECRATRRAKGQRVLVTTLTKRMAEALTRIFARGRASGALHALGSSTRSSASRSSAICGWACSTSLIGINLLREGLDIPGMRAGRRCSMRTRKAICARAPRFDPDDRARGAPHRRARDPLRRPT